VANLPPMSTTPVANLPPILTTQAANSPLVPLEKSEMDLMGYSDT